MVDRITLLLKTRNISASQFADEIGVQRSSISHVLSGRNKPSLDFIQKILVRYPEINPDWLLFGKGSMNLEYNLFSELADPVPLKPEALSKAITRQERPIRAVPEDYIVRDHQSENIPDENEKEEEVITNEISSNNVNQVNPVENEVVIQEIIKPELINEPEPITEIISKQVEPVQQKEIVSPPPIKQPSESVETTPLESIQQPYTGSATIAALAPLVEKEVQQITIFYKDRTFILYKPG